MAQTTLERHQTARDAVASDVGDLMNQIADRIALGIADGHYPDGLTVNLQRAYSAALSVGPELAPRPAPTTGTLLGIELIEPTPSSDPS